MKGGEFMYHKNDLLYFVIIIIAIMLGMWFLLSIPRVRAAAVAKVTWCHVEPNGNQQTLELPQAALENAGHVNAAGNPLHAGDHLGVCVEVTPTVAPTSELTTTPTLTPTPEVTPTPTAGASATTGGDGLSDGRSDGLSSCPECTKAPVVVPQGAPNTGRGL